MQAYRQSSLVQQPDGELIRAVVDEASSLPEATDEIQFSLGMLGRQVIQDDLGTQDVSQEGSPDSSSGAQRHGRVCCAIRPSLQAVVTPGTTI